MVCKEEELDLATVISELKVVKSRWINVHSRKNAAIQGEGRPGLFEIFLSLTLVNDVSIHVKEEDDAS